MNKDKYNIKMYSRIIWLKVSVAVNLFLFLPYQWRVDYLQKKFYFWMKILVIPYFVNAPQENSTDTLDVVSNVWTTTKAQRVHESPRQNRRQLLRVELLKLYLSVEMARKFDIIPSTLSACWSWRNNDDNDWSIPQLAAIHTKLVKHVFWRPRILVTRDCIPIFCWVFQYDSRHWNIVQCVINVWYLQCQINDDIAVDYLESQQQAKQSTTKSSVNIFSQPYFQP